MEEKELRTGTEEGKDSGAEEKDGQEYEKICYICRRPESKAGSMIVMPGNMCLCHDCMQKAFDSIMGGGMNIPGMDLSKVDFSKISGMPYMNMNFSVPPEGVDTEHAGIAPRQQLKKKKKKDENGNIIECKERTGMWAWKHPHSADGSVSYTELTGDVRFEDVTFGYNEDKVILKDISLFAKPGQKLAFVGSTGAGKTTITNLINRFYDIQEGKIRYDGINITKIKKDDLRRSLGIVLQDTHLFTGTIMDNIRYGKLDATDEEVYEAAKLAHADQFIKMLPKGYDTMLSGDGEELSQGQRQLLSIARAAVANPPVLILDEATSSIDTRTESIVQKGMDNLMKGRTVFVIAHRLSTIRNSDAIIVLEHGKIIERGDHADLIKMKGTYYQLYTGKLELS